jgi:hypothetical protein
VPLPEVQRREKWPGAAAHHHSTESGHGENQNIMAGICKVIGSASGTMRSQFNASGGCSSAASARALNLLRDPGPP